jgi:hypothetical protein
MLWVLETGQRQRLCLSRVRDVGSMSLKSPGPYLLAMLGAGD